MTDYRDNLLRLAALLGALALRLALVLVSSTAFGLDAFKNEFQNRYPNIQATCEVCHSPQTKKVRNVYGQALDALLSRADAGNPAKIQQALETVEKHTTFGELLRAGQLPAKHVKQTAAAPKSYEFTGTWHTERNIKLDGTMTAVLTGVSKDKWRGKFTGVWQGEPFSYDVEITGPATALVGTAIIDGASYEWRGFANTKQFKANFTGSRYAGGFDLRRIEAAIDAKPAANKATLVMFHADWCGPCQSMKPVVAELKREGVDVRAVNCTNGTPEKWRGMVSGYPTFLVYSGETYKGKQVGVCSKQRLAEMLAEAGK